MKQFLNILGLAILLAIFSTSCKKSTLDTLHDNELIALDKYILDNNLSEFKDNSGIYFKLLERSTDTVTITSGFKLLLEFKITLLDGTLPYSYYFTTDDGYGHNYEPRIFYVDINDSSSPEYIQQIAGLHTGLKKMHKGDRAFMVIPSEMAFKAVDNSSFGIPRFSTLLATVYIKNAYSVAQQSE